MDDKPESGDTPIDPRQYFLDAVRKIAASGSDEQAAQIFRDALGVPDWDCEAYGPRSRGTGALCFVAEPGTRSCLSARMCADRMAGARQHLFRRMNEMAAAGDEVGEHLAEQFTTPAQLLGGSEDPPEFRAEPGA